MDRIGTLYGVYHFLELQGIRWYAPGETGCSLPVLSTLKIPVHMIMEEPKFVTRGFWAWEDRGNLEFYLWMARNRLNFWTIAEPDYGLLRKIGIQLTAGGHLHFDRFLNPDDEYPYNHARYQGDEDKPADPYKDSDTNQLSKKDKLTYFEAHPEWYGLIKGERQTFEGDLGTNICTSNHDAVVELCRKLIDDLAEGEWRNVSTLNFWPLDVGKWCECRECQSLGTPTDRLLVLIHQVRRAIEQAISDGRLNRNVKVIFPIYIETLPPPTRILPVDFDYDNCIGTFFPIRRCYVHFLDDTSCTEYNTEIWNEFLKWIENEPRYYNGQFLIGEYYNVSSIRSLPVLFTRVMTHDIPLYYRNGVRHAHYMHVNTSSWGPKRINNYLFAKLLWNHEIQVEPVLNEYYQQFYQGAGKQMQNFYQQLEYAMCSVKQWKHTKPLTSRINNDELPLFNLQHLQLNESHPTINDGVDLEESVNALAKCRTIIDSLLLQEWPDLITRRLSEDDQHLEYAKNTANLYYYVAQSILALNQGNKSEAIKMYQLSIPFARGLEKETEIVNTSSSHANAVNGLEASLIKERYQKLAKELNQAY